MRFQVYYLLKYEYVTKKYFLKNKLIFLFRHSKLVSVDLNFRKE